MKLLNGLLLLTISVVMLLCFAFTIAKPTNTVHRTRIKKEKAVSRIISIKPTSIVDREEIRKEEAVSRIADYIGDENEELQEEEVRTISQMVYDESMRCNVDYRLVLALMKIESNFRYDAVSEQGARGLLQVKPSLARYIAEDVGIGWRGDKTLDEPEQNIKIGVHVFSKLIEDFQSINMALHAYHVGPTRLREILFKKKIPQKHYLNLVLDEYNRNISLLPAP
jgi:soluble lytic murein transglycosylase